MCTQRTLLLIFFSTILVANFPSTGKDCEVLAVQLCNASSGFNYFVLSARDSPNSKCSFAVIAFKIT